MVVRVRVTVQGAVHGVGFRFGTRVEAQRLRVAGWVRNRSDGAVEAEVEGEASAVDAMLAWFDEGPPGANVTMLTTTDLTPTGEQGFQIRS
jgi:acylphosphatase